MNVTLRQLRAFLAVARTGSFTLAAESLYISQSALSGLVKELEQSMGVRLIDRSTRRVHLTEAGERLSPMLDTVLHNLDEVLHRAVDDSTNKKGVVRVAVSQLLASTLMPDLIARFQTEHPGGSVKLVDVPVEDVMARVFSGEVDIGIGPEREPNSDITSAHLFDGPFMAVYPPVHPLRRTAGHAVWPGHEATGPARGAPQLRGFHPPGPLAVTPGPGLSGRHRAEDSGHAVSGVRQAPASKILQSHRNVLAHQAGAAQLLRVQQGQLDQEQLGLVRAGLIDGAGQGVVDVFQAGQRKGVGWGRF